MASATLIDLAAEQEQRWSNLARSRIAQRHGDRLNGHDVFFFRLERGINLRHVLVSQSLHFIMKIPRFVLRDLAVLLLFAKQVNAIAADVAYRDAALFGIFVRHFDKFLTSFAGQRGNVETNQLTVIIRHEPDIRHRD